MHKPKVGDKLFWRYERSGCEMGELEECRVIAAIDDYIYTQRPLGPDNYEVLMFIIKTWDNPEHDYKLYRDKQHADEKDEVFDIVTQITDMYAGNWQALGIEKLRKIQEIVDAG